MSVTRRTMLAAPPAVAAATMTNQVFAQNQPTAPGQAATPEASQQAPGFYRYKVGDIEVTAINDGFARRPLENFVRNADLAAVKKAMEERFLPQDALPITFTSLVLNAGGRIVLIDTGNGDSGAPTTGTWMTNFRAAGFDPARVNTVVISHFHGDHINGLRRKDGTAVFANAEVTVPAPEWAFWMDDGKMGQAPDGLKPNFQNVRRVFGPIAKDVKPFEAGKEVVPGLTAVAAYGHTPGHVAFVLSSGQGKLMVMSDITNHPALFVRNPDWAAVFDQDADVARATRHKLLDMAASERAQVSFYHAPFPATGHIPRDGKTYEFVPVQWSPAI
jgi:glyoxylase-like metal-dependent hydrolase (beta-lactamase superfamily II)